MELKACSGFILREIAGEWILMPVGNNIGRFRGTVLMNELSVFVWQRMQTPVSRDQLLKEILERYQTDPQTAASDLDELLASMKAMGIIEE